jgi:hypothetical protein
MEVRQRQSTSVICGDLRAHAGLWRNRSGADGFIAPRKSALTAFAITFGDLTPAGERCATANSVTVTY